jgi:methylated-DNA-[protein]-cysteine S-methyltransferase
MLAEAVGCKSARAVGQTLKRNPFAPLVPCHRVIASDLTPGGYRGKQTTSMIHRKVALLASEGVYFKNGKLTDKRKLYRFIRRYL